MTYNAPDCLFDNDVRPLQSGLVESVCSYDSLKLTPDCFNQAGIPLPPRLAPAAAKRQTEYLAGRWCARQAIAALGGSGYPTQDGQGAPCWPVNLTGSITHSRGLAVVLVGACTHWRAVGIDAEQWIGARRARRLSQQLLTRKEQQHFDRLPADRQSHYLTLAFSVKEALFKALNPLTGIRFYFQDAELVDAQHIELRTDLAGQWREGERIAFHSVSSETHLLTRILIPA